MLFKIIDKYRKEADYHFHHNYSKYSSWRQAILEAIFRPKARLPPGKSPMSHLHPNIDKLHLPEHVYIADWRKYRVEDHPALMEFQKRCHASGLHDPWLRNFAFEFYPNIYQHRSRFAFITQGCVFGIVLGGIIYGLERVYDIYYPTNYVHSKARLKNHNEGEKHH